MKRTVTDLQDKKFLSVDECQKVVSLGRNSCMKLGREAEAVVKVGGRTLYDIEKILAYLKERTEVANNEKNED